MLAIILKHIASKSIDKINNLSRRENWTEKVKRNNKNQIILKKE